MPKPTHHVALALVHRLDRWLVARRPPNVHLGGLWEFPGGKCEADELPQQAALRELREECRVEATAERCLPPVQYDYEDRVVSLTPVICRWATGAGQPLAGQECRWVTTAELQSLEMPAANEPILRALLDQDR